MTPHPVSNVEFDLVTRIPSIGIRFNAASDGLVIHDENAGFSSSKNGFANACREQPEDFHLPASA